MPDAEPNEPTSSPRNCGPASPAQASQSQGQPPVAGKCGEGASSAMAQIRRDRLAQVWVAPTAEDQIRGLWRERAPIERNFAGILALEAWLTHNAPELLQGHGESHPYLLRLLDGEIEN